ncbi:MAG: hypothetical protein QM756_05750 [Polyangiaceae bacterium]
MSQIHFIGGEKGGVGKSVMARVLSQWLLDRSQPYAGADADTTNGSLLRSYSQNTQAVDLESFPSADEIMNRALGGDRRVVVDLPAQSMRHLQRWFDSADIVRFAREMGIGLTLFHVSDGGFDSVASLERTLQSLGDRFNYVVVRNFGRSKDFSQLEQSEAKRHLEGLGGRQIDLPELEPSTMYKIDRFGSSFWSAVNNEEAPWALTPMERQRVRAWLERCYQGLESLGDRI